MSEERHGTPGFFEWQYSGPNDITHLLELARYDPDKYWGGFPAKGSDALPDWAIGPFSRSGGNPVFAPDPHGWDSGRFGGGVHNGSILRHGGQFVYVYRGELPLPGGFWPDGFTPRSTDMQMIDYICDLGVAVSDDGEQFTRVTGPLFRHGSNERFSYEDVCVVRNDGGYVLFCNRWDWTDNENPSRNGVWLARSKDLIDWEEIGLAFPNATRIHRNACVLQSPENDAVRLDGRFVMYLNDGIIAYSDDLISWHSEQARTTWPGGENCFALADHNPSRPDDIVVFTGGHHSGHFYAVGEVLLSKGAPSTVLDVLSRPVLAADPAIPWEDGRSVVPGAPAVSYFRDTIFFTGMTRFENQWWLYYGGSEYYTCLAVAAADHRDAG